MKIGSNRNDVLLRGILFLAATFLVPYALQARPKGQGKQVNPHARILQDFENRIAEYVKLHKSIEGKLPALTPTDAPEKILQHQQELARRIREARQQASQGNIFAPEIREEFRNLIGASMRGKQAARIHESLVSSEPVQFPLNVNASYPPGEPLQSTPPTLLQNLPKLPAELEYRIVGHQLILRDVNANLIVDVMAEAIP